MKMDKAEGVAAIEVERYSKQGTARLQQGEPKKAVEAFRNAYQSSQLLGHHGYMQRACAFNLGAILVSTGSFNEGLLYLNQATPPEGRKDGRSNGDLFFNFGLAYEGLKNKAESTAYYEKALGEYKLEQNSKMEADVYQRLAKVHVEAGNFQEAVSYQKQLKNAYDLIGDKEKSVQIQAETAGLLLKLGKLEEAEQLADECLSSSEQLTSPTVAGNVLVELGLIYTQAHNFDKAISCSQQAMGLVRSPLADPKLAAVLFQNLGAIYNHTENYKEAIAYHTTAAEKHALLKNRKSQGHCFLNLGFAYSQLGDMDKAGENFLHSYQAAKDCGDKKTEWQSLEALGAVAYNQRAFTRAQTYYKDALTAFAHSPECGDVAIQERILSKLKKIIELLIPKSQAEVSQTNVTSKPPETDESDAEAEETTAPLEDTEKTEQVTVEETMNSSRGKRRVEGRVFALKRGGETRFVKVRRSGTLRKFKKVALGLDLDADEEKFDLMKPVEVEDISGGNEMEISQSDVEGMDEPDKDLKNSVLELTEGNVKKFIKLKASGTLRKFKEKNGEEECIYQVLESEGELDVQDGFTSEEDESKDDDDNDEEGHKKRHVRPPDSYLAHSSHAAFCEMSTESEDGDMSVEDEEDEEDKEKNAVRAAMMQLSRTDDKKAITQPVQREVIADVHAQPESSSGSDGESDTSSDSDEESTPKRSPPVPTASPPPTGGIVGTYEQAALKPELVYETIDHKPPSGRSLEEKKVSIADPEGTIYESIRPQSRRGRNTPGEEEESDEEGKEETDRETEKLSRAERDVIHYASFHKDQEKEKEQAEVEAKERIQKSRFCTIM